MGGFRLCCLRRRGRGWMRLMREMGRGVKEIEREGGW